MELEDIMEESIKLMEQSFYSDKFYFSYSSINKLMWNPVVFHQLYILGIREEKPDSHLVQGRAIHALLLEEEKFNEKFFITPSVLPTGNTKAVLDSLDSHAKELSRNGYERCELGEYGNAILDILSDMNLHQNLKTDQQRIDKIVTPESINYWNFLTVKGTKTLIDAETYKYCCDAVLLIRENKKICDLIGCNITEFDNKEIFNELPLQVDVTNRSFGLKGIIDNLVFDHDNKIIYINDVKTTSKELRDFHESVEFYSYWMQAAIYCSLVGIKYAHLLGAGYQLKFHFLVIDKSFHTYAFPVKESTLIGWLDRLDKTFDKVEWHYKNKSYELPYEFATDSVTL